MFRPMQQVECPGKLDKRGLFRRFDPVNWYNFRAVHRASKQGHRYEEDI
jgi:hypothetical protein